MLIRQHNQFGFTLIEIMIGLTIAAVLLAMAAPNFSAWIQNMQLRNAAEAINTGLQLTRSEAVKRNTRVSLSFTTSIDNSCEISNTGTDWIMSLGDPSSDLSGNCGAAPSPDDESASPPRIIQKRSSKDGSVNAAVSTSQSIISFAGTGKASFIAGVTSNPPTTVTIDITNPSAGSCMSVGGPVRCLRVMVSPGGQIRMCDPSRPSSDPQGC